MTAYAAMGIYFQLHAVTNSFVVLNEAFSRLPKGCNVYDLSFYYYVKE